MPDEPIPEPEQKLVAKGTDDADTHAESESESEEQQSSSSSDSEDEEKKKLLQLEYEVRAFLLPHFNFPNQRNSIEMFLFFLLKTLFKPRKHCFLMHKRGTFLLVCSLFVYTMLCQS